MFSISPRWLGFVCCWTLLAASSSPAADPAAFPYEAVVRTDEVEVRSGPGQRYYVTGKVTRNERVTVHRHDPGGWYMISPPPGSFSWIEASLVQTSDGMQGVVDTSTADGAPATAIVRIGSEFSDDHGYYGRELSNGDAVQILGEKTLISERGAVRMYKIEPPALEYRWVKGDYIVAAEAPPPAGAEIPAPSAADGVQPAGFERPEESDPFSVRQLEAAPEIASASSAPQLVRRTDRGLSDAMADLDQRYLELIRQTPDQWDLEGLVSAYTQLRTSADAELRTRIDDRLAALESRRKIWDEYREFVQLTQAVEQRDAELQAMQQAALESPFPQQGPTLAAPGETFAGPQPPSPAGGAQLQAAMPAGFPRLSGAGIVQRLTSPSGPIQFGLTDSQGRLLAVLWCSPDLGLDSYVGQSLGVVGQRSFDPRMGTDVIRVRQLLPVQLAP